MNGLSAKPIQDDLFADETKQMDNASETTSRTSRSGHTVGDRPAPFAQAPLTMEEMAQQLEQSGNYRVLRKLQPRLVGGLPFVGMHKIGVILDTETTGLDHTKDEIIELGMVAFTYDDTGIRDVIGVFSALQEPSVPVSAEITRITGITTEMVKGQKIDIDAVVRFIEPADLVIAHNARFDRPFCEKFSSGFDIKPWACSVSEVDWSGLGFEGTKLATSLAKADIFTTDTEPSTTATPFWRFWRRRLERAQTTPSVSCSLRLHRRGFAFTRSARRST